MNFYKKGEDTGKQTSFDQLIIDYMNFEAWLKKKQKSPKVNDQKMLKTFYSKRKAKSENSPKNESRVNPRDLIKINIKDLQCQPSQRPIRRHPEQASGQRSTLRSSLTPKSFHYSKPGAKSSKGGQTRGKQLFKSSGRQGNYPQTQQDLRHALERKKQQDLKEKERGIYRRNYASYDSNCVAQGKAHEEQTTVKISERVRDQGGFNVRACLTPDEYSKFGERFPENFKRAGLLGRGGFSVVWLAIHRFSKRKVAVKQILTKNPHQTHLKEIWFGSYFFQKGGQSRQQFEDHIGINNICRLLSYEIGPVDTWLYYQLCEESLGSCLFQLKGESVGGQRIYRIDYKQVIESIRVDQNQLQTLIVQVSKGLLLMNSHNIVHSDLKTENILLRLRRPQQIRQGHGLIRGVKLIDFGSSFLFTNLKQFSMATPQYMPPQILNYILYQNKLEYNHEMLTQMDRYKNSWIIDIWSLGCIILEIISGVPLWMSIDTKIQGRGSKVTGLFAIKNRVFAKIIQKQIEVISNLDYHLDNNNHSGIEIRQDIRIVLKKMLHLDPEQRISPIEILKHFKVSCQPLRIPSY